MFSDHTSDVDGRRSAEEREDNDGPRRRALNVRPNAEELPIAPESVTQLLWKRLISRHSAPDWTPPASHILLCGGVARMGGCIEQLMRLQHLGVRVVALCHVPPVDSSSYQTWLTKAAPLLATPPETFTLVRGSDLDQDDLLFAGASTARAVLVFAASVEEQGTSSMSSSHEVAKQTADCTTVLTALRVKHVSPSVFTCCEVHESANARFFRLTQGHGLNANLNKFQVPFMHP